VVGLLWAAAMLLGFAGVGKTLRPLASAVALRAASIPGSSVLASLPIVRVGGLLEVIVAASVLLWGGSVAAALLSASYLLLTLTAWRMLVVTPGNDCGCFGSSTEPINQLHLVVNSGYLLVGAAAVYWPQPGVLTQLTTQGAEGVAVVVLAGVLAWLSYLLMTELPALLALRAKVAASK